MSANPRKRRRNQLHPPHIKIHPPQPQPQPPPPPPTITDAIDDPISTPLLTPRDIPHHPARGQHPSRFTPLAQTPPPVPTPPPTHTPPTTPKPPHTPAQPSFPSQPPPQSSQWSGGLFSGHKPLTIESLRPTPPSTATLVCPPPRLPQSRHDARVRRLSFGIHHTPPNRRNTPPPPVREQPIQYESSRRDDQHLHHDDDDYDQHNPDIPETVSHFLDTPPQPHSAHPLPELRTPAPSRSLPEMSTPDDTVVRRCRAPKWHGPITQIPETPTEQLPPREAPVYLVNTITTAPAQLPSLPQSPPSSPPLSPPSSPVLDSPTGRRKMGLLWMDIGAPDSGDKERTRTLDEDSDSASTEPPSPVRKRDNEQVEVVPCRARVFCRSVRVSIPAGGFRSPSPERTPSDT